MANRYYECIYVPETRCITLEIDDKVIDAKFYNGFEELNLKRLEEDAVELAKSKGIKTFATNFTKFNE